MSPSVRLGLLALISSAAAVPQYAHNRFHHRALAGYSMPGHSGSGAPYPTGHGGHNHTHPHPHGPHGSGSLSVSTHEPTTTLLQTDTSTLTVYSTIYASPSPVSAGAENVYGVGVSSAAAHCGPETVYVTATNKVTVTVTPGTSSSSSSSSSAAAAVLHPSSAKPAVSSSAAYVPKPQPKPSSSAEAAASSAPAYKASPVIPSAMAIPTAAEKPSLAISIINKAPSAPAAAKPAASKAATSTPQHYSGAKRGLAYNDASLCSQFNTGSYGFSYNWGQTGQACAGGAFVPMMHKPSDSSASDWLSNVDKAVAAGAKMVMGFNECDIATQANMSPQQACADWKTYMNPIRAKHPSVTILGPSVSNSGQPNQGLDWLDQFHAACPDAIWDAANIHFYDIPTDGVVGRFTDHLQSAKDKYGKQVFVTEFGLNAGSATPDQAQSFLSGVMEYMDGEESCGGYAYFMVGTDPSMNMMNVAGGLSAVGKVYNS